MNELYTQTELIRGRWYRYDPDHDVWRPIEPEESPISAWAWLAVILLFSLVVYLGQYLKN